MNIDILLINDGADASSSYRHALQDHGCALRVALTAEKGLAHITSTDSADHPDLILIDANSPGASGLDFMRRLQDRPDIRIPIIMLTGEGNAMVAAEAMKLGACDYIIRDAGGIYLRSLPGMIRNVMTTHKQHKRNRLQQVETGKLLHRNHILMKHSIDGIHLMDIQGNIVEANDAFCGMLGYTQEEMSGMNVADWDARWQADELRKRFRDLIGKSTQVETLHRRKDGSLINVEISVSGLEINGQPFLFAASRDITERKMAEATLIQHKQMIDASIDGYWMVDMQGNLLEVNQAYARMSGYTATELLNMHISQLDAFEGNPEEVRAHIARVILNGHERFETRHRRKDGQLIDMEISAAYLPQSQKLCGFCRDISERKQSEESLLRSEANLQAMLDNSPYLCWLKDSDGRYIKINKVFADFLQLGDPAQAIGKTDLDLQPAELAQKYRADDAEVMAARRQKHVEESAFDGERGFWVETYKTPIVDMQGNVLGTVGFASDITERKRMQLETEALLRRNQALMKASMDGIHILDMQGRVVEANQAFCRMLGYGMNEVLQLEMSDWMTESSAGKSHDLLQEYLGKSLMLETMFRCKDGSFINVETSITGELIDGQGLLFCSSRDITERKRMENALLQISLSEAKRADALELQFGSLLQSSINEIYMFDADTLRFLETSAGAEHNLGYSAEELELLTPLDIIPGYTRDAFELLVAPLRRGEQPALIFNTDFRRIQGTLYPVEVRLQLMKSAPAVFLAIVQDITDRKHAENALRQSAQEITDLYNNAPCGYHSLDKDGVICRINNTELSWLGYERDEIEGRTRLTELLTPASIQTFRNTFPEFRKTGLLRDIELELVRKDGTVLVALVNATAIYNDLGEFLMSRTTLIDITERKRMELQSQELAAHLNHIREEEKGRIAREIHDELGGTLASLKMDAHWLTGKLSGAKGTETLVERTTAMYTLLDSAVNAMRRISTNLRPTMLDDLGLPDTLRWMALQFRDRTGIECRVAIHGEDDCTDKLDGALSINLYRIFQEALTNVSRHSGASCVDVLLRIDPDLVKLSVRDNGCGLPEGKTVAPTSFGLRGMRERVAQLGGEIKLLSPSHGGFQIVVTLPQ